MNLLEREAETAVLENLFGACLNGQGAVAMISGALGSGKTALLQTFRERVDRPDVTHLRATVTHLRATACPSEQSLPMGLIDQLFRSGDLAASYRARLSWILAHGALDASAPKECAEVGIPLSSLVLYGLRDILNEMAGSGPLVITIDDAHFSDAASLRCLTHLIHRLQSMPVMVVMSECSHASSMRRFFHSEILGLANCRHIRLKPLSPAGVASLIAERMGTQAARCLSPSCYEATGGNPLLLRGLTADCQEVSAEHPRMVPGEAFNRSVLAIIYRAEPTLIDIAGALAVLDDAVPVEFLGALLNMDTASVVEAMAILTDAGLLDSGGFRRDEARLAILNGMLPDPRAEIHRRAARLLHSEGAAPPVVARHLTAGGNPVAPWGIRALRDAARQAPDEGDLIAAVGYLRQAFRACDDAREKGRIAVELTAAEWRIDPSAVGRYLPTLAEAHSRGDLDADQTVVLASHLVWHGRAAQAVDVLGNLSEPASVHDGRDGMLTAAEAARLYLDDFVPGLSAAALPGGPPQRRPVQCPHRRTDQAAGITCELPAGRTVQHRAILGLDAVLRSGARPEVLCAAEQTLQLTHLNDLNLMPICCALLVLLYADKHDSAAYWCDSLLKEAQAGNVPMWHSLFAVARSAIHLCMGELPGAEKRIDEALALIPPQSWGTAVGAPLAIMVRTTTALGAFDKAARYASLPVSDAIFLNLSGPHFLSARGHLLLATNQPDAALRDFTRCGELMCRWGIDQPAVVPWRADAAQAHLRLGDPARARRLADDQLARLRPGPSRTRGITLRVLAAGAAPDEREPLLREAAQVSAASGDQLNLAYALADLGAAHRAMKQYSRARSVTERALRLAGECGAAPLVRSLAEDAAPLDRSPAGFRDPGAPGAPTRTGVAGRRLHTDVLAKLSAAERRVAALAAEGCTNHQIARRLYITVSTVEQHLTRVYRKLEIHHRAELPNELRLAPHR